MSNNPSKPFTVFIVRPRVWEHYQDCYTRGHADHVADFLTKAFNVKTYIHDQERVPMPVVR